MILDLWGRHSCLPAQPRADRNVRATFGVQSSSPVDTCRYPSAVPAVPARSRTRTIGLVFCASAAPSFAFDKVWGQGVGTRCKREAPTLNPLLNSLKRHAYSTRLLHFRVHWRPFAVPSLGVHWRALASIRGSTSWRALASIRGSTSWRALASIRGSTSWRSWRLGGSKLQNFRTLELPNFRTYPASSRLRVSLPCCFRQRRQSYRQSSRDKV
jgi:hypothetical protein